jgi:hypothetical protein
LGVKPFPIIQVKANPKPHGIFLAMFRNRLLNVNCLPAKTKGIAIKPLSRLKNRSRNSQAIRFALVLSTCLMAWTANANSCRHLFTAQNSNAQTFLLPNIQEIDLSTRYFSPSTPSVKVSATRTRSGLIEIQQTGESWYSRFKKGINDIQGDPRWFALILGPKIGFNFGFQAMGEMKITVPTVERFEQARGRYNIALKAHGFEEITSSFYPAPSQPLTGIIYLERFAKSGGLPVAINGHLIVHDWAFHGATILFPKVIMNHLRDKARFLLKLHTHLKSHPGISREEKDFALSSVNSLMENAVNLIDYTSGNLPAMLIRREFHKRAGGTRQVDDKLLYNDTLSYGLEQFSEMISYNSIKTTLNYAVKSDPRLSEAGVKNTFIALEEFYATNPIPEMPKDSVATADGFNKYIGNRIKELITVTEALENTL